MLDLKVNFVSLLVDQIGTEEFTLPIEENSTIKDVLNKLTEKFGAKFKKVIFKSPETLNDFVIIGLNGKDIRLIEYLNTLLKQGDEITFLPAVAGG